MQFASDLLMAIPDAIVVADADGLIRFWNPGAERIFGFSAAEAVGVSLDIIVPERQRQRHWAGYAKVIETGASRYGVDDLLAVPAIRKDGTRISIQFTVAVLRGPDGRPNAVAAVLRDVSTAFAKRRSLEREAAELRSRLADSGSAMGCPGHWRRSFGQPGETAPAGPVWLPKAE